MLVSLQISASRWGEVSRCGTYVTPDIKASCKGFSLAGSCDEKQNLAGTRKETWHDSDTSGSRDVPADTTENAAALAGACGAKSIQEGSRLKSEHSGKKPSSAMGQFAAESHKRAARMLGYTLTLGDFDAWESFSLFMIAKLEPEERAALAWASLRSLTTEQAEATTETVLGRNAPNWPEPAIFNLMREAAFWADHASEEELGAYCLATFRSMPPERQSAFLAFVRKGDAS